MTHPNDNYRRQRQLLEPATTTAELDDTNDAETTMNQGADRQIWLSLTGRNS